MWSLSQYRHCHFMTDLVSWAVCDVSLLLKHNTEIRFIHVIWEHHLYHITCNKDRISPSDGRHLHLCDKVQVKF